MQMKRKIKIVFCFAMVIILSFCSMAAIVSDNDGSAFVTKSEFEALKNDFSSQIDNYNSSIDRKIDGAIASYLAGRRTVNVEEVTSILNNIYDRYFKPNTKKPYMFNRRDNQSYGDSDINHTMSLVVWFQPDYSGNTFLTSNGESSVRPKSYVNCMSKETIKGTTYYFDRGYLYDFSAGTAIFGVTYESYAASAGRNNTNTIIEPSSTNQYGYYPCGNYNLYSENSNFTNRIMHFEYYKLPKTDSGAQFYEMTTDTTTNNIYYEYLGMMEKFRVDSNINGWRRYGSGGSSSFNGYPNNQSHVYVQMMKPVMASKNILDLYSYAIYKETGELAHLYSGYPICVTTREGDIRLKLKATVSTSIIVSKEQFSNNTYSDELTRLTANGTLVASGTGINTLDVTDFHVKKDDMLWVKIYNQGNITTEYIKLLVE